MLKRLSNHAEFAPPEGFVLQAGETWTIKAHGMSYHPKHWTDGANAGYVVLADNSTVPVSVAPTRAKGDNAALTRGAVVYPVPKVAPVPVSVVPWPSAVSVSGRLAPQVGLDLKPDGAEADAAAQAFKTLTDGLFPVEGHRPAGGGGWFSRLAVVSGRLCAGSI